MTEKQEEKVREDVIFVEGLIKDLQRELADKECTLTEKIDMTLYVAMKIKSALNYVNDTTYIKEIIETYEGE